MGTEYHLEAENGDKSTEIELSIVGYLSLKSPDEAVLQLLEWIAFLRDHSGQKIRLLDDYRKETDPAHVNGGYTIGVQDYDPQWKPKGRPG